MNARLALWDSTPGKTLEPRRSAPKRSAFTLIEVVVSAALMTIILTGAYLCLSSGLSGQRLIESRGEVLQHARVAMTLMSADLRSACVLSKDFEFLGMHRMLGEMEADNLDFGTQNYTPRRDREGDFCEVSYFVNKEPRSGKLTLWRRRDPTPDDEPLSGGSREEIARGLTGLKFEYYDGFDWYDEWGDPAGRKAKGSRRNEPNMSGLPEAVRITIWIESNSRSSAGIAEKKQIAESPLMFQTVARLNLAAVSHRKVAAASQEKGGDDKTGQSKDAPPEGGAP